MTTHQTHGTSALPYSLRDEKVRFRLGSGDDYGSVFSQRDEIKNDRVDVKLGSGTRRAEKMVLVAWGPVPPTVVCGGLCTVA